MQRMAVVFLVMSSALGACDMSNLFGKEVGRIPFTGEGSGKTTAQLAAGDVSFWTAIDIAYEGDAALVYKIEVSQGDKVVGSTTCNPLGELPSKTNFMSSDIAGRHTRSGNGKMECVVKLPAAGSTTVEATLAWGTKPATLALKRADLVIKQ